jgi:hypothetical protein
MTTYNGPRQLRDQKDFDRLTAELVRSQPTTERSVIRWREDVPVPLDSIVIVFTPIAGGSLVLPRLEARDDGRTIVVAIADGSGPLTVECPRVDAAAERKELVQPGAYTFYAIDRIYYVDTAIVGAVPPAAVEFALESDGTSVLGKYDAGTGAVAPIVAQVDNTVLTRSSGILDFTTVSTSMLDDSSISTIKIQDSAVTYNKIQQLPAYSVIGNNSGATATSSGISAAFEGGVLQRTVAGTVQFAFLTDDNFSNNSDVGFDKLESGSAGVPIFPGGVGASGTLTGISPTATSVLLGSTTDPGSAVFWGKVAPDHMEVATDSLTGYYLLSAAHGDSAFFRVDLDDGDIGLSSTELVVRSNVIRRSRSHFGDFARYMCSVSKNTNQNIAAASGFVAITWDNEIVDRESMHSTASTTSRIQIPAAGLYLVSWTIIGTGGDGLLRIRLDGTSQYSDDYPVSDGVPCSQTIMMYYPQGYIELMYDSIGGTTTLIGSNPPSCLFTVMSMDL